MKREFKAPKGQRNERKARRLDRKKVLDLHRKGLSTVEIARHQGVAPSSVWRFLEMTKPQQEALERFKGHRADELARVHGKAIEVQHLALDRIKVDLEDDVVAKALSPGQKTQYLNAAAIVGGVSFDKERLERGLATSHVSVVSRLIDEEVKSLYMPKPTATPPVAVRKGVTGAK